MFQMNVEIEQENRRNHFRENLHKLENPLWKVRIYPPKRLIQIQNILIKHSTIFFL